MPENIPSWLRNALFVTGGFIFGSAYIALFWMLVMLALGRGGIAGNMLAAAVFIVMGGGAVLLVSLARQPDWLSKNPSGPTGSEKKGGEDAASTATVIIPRPKKTAARPSPPPADERQPSLQIPGFRVRLAGIASLSQTTFTVMQACQWTRIGDSMELRWPGLRIFLDSIAVRHPEKFAEPNQDGTVSWIEPLCHVVLYDTADEIHLIVTGPAPLGSVNSAVIAVGTLNELQKKRRVTNILKKRGSICLGYDKW